MPKFKVGDIVKYVYKGLEGQSKSLDNSIWKVTSVGIEQLSIVCINGAKSNLRPGDREEFRINRFELIQSKTKEELICDKIKQMSERHIAFQVRKHNVSPNKEGTMSSVC